jgi:hypothetical protein
MGTQERGRDMYSLYVEPAFLSANNYNAEILDIVKNATDPSSREKQTCCSCLRFGARLTDCMGLMLKN